MLEPRSASAKHSSNSGKSHGIRNLPGSPNSSRNVFRMTAKQFSLIGVLVNSKILPLLFKSFLNIGANLGMCRRASAKLSSKYDNWFINLDYRRLDVFGTSVRKYRVRCHLRLVSWVLINQGLIHWGLLLNLGSLEVVAISTVLVLVPTILIVGLAVVLHGRKTGWSDLACETYSWMLSRAGAGTGDVCLSRSRALTISFNSATSGDTPEVEALALYFSNNGFASGVTNFGLAFDDA
ncbi:hypothetical protein Tco_1222066 [Tanacetum coccineum]